jgi:uncharacterized membrane protein
MWVPFVLVFLAALVVTAVGWWGLQGKLPRQFWAGIRTPYSLANDEQWLAVHRYGAPYLIFGGVAAAAASLAMIPFALAGKLPSGFAAASLIAIALVLGISGLMSWVLGVRGAKASLGQ